MRKLSRGFTLIELVVVAVVLGILAGISAVGWNVFVTKARTGQVGSLMDRVSAVEQPLARDYGSYTAWPADLADVGSDAKILNGKPSRSAEQVSLAVGSGGSLGMAVRLGDACIFRLVAPLSAGGGSSTPDGIPASATCTGQSALPDSEDALVQTSSVTALS